MSKLGLVVVGVVTQREPCSRRHQAVHQLGVRSSIQLDKSRRRRIDVLVDGVADDQRFQNIACVQDTDQYQCQQKQPGLWSREVQQAAHQRQVE